MPYPPPVTFSNISFDVATGQLSIQGDASDNTVQEWIGDRGYLQIDLDGQMKSSDPLSAFFDTRLRGATRETISRIDFDGGDGRDTLILGNQDLSDSLQITADDDILINGNLKSGDRIDVEAENITSQGALFGRGITLNSSDVLQLESGSITAQDGDKGGTIHLLGKEVSLVGTEVNADGMNGGGTVLIGGDYQGKGSVPNARTTFIDANTVINVDALRNGNGGKAIVWADDTTRFLGKINARGGSRSGDGGFAEVSGKQNLLFQGLADLSATNGSIGTLLLDPTDIIISDAPVNPSDPPEPQRIDVASLQETAASISLVATNSISTTDLNFVSPGGSISFVAGAGGFTGGNITAPGRNIEITGDFISAGAINTSSETSSGGSINLTGINEISVASLNSTSTDGSGGDVALTSESGTIAAGNIYASAFGNGNGGSVMLTVVDGEITTGDISGSSENGDGGAITISSNNDIDTGALGTNTFSTGTAGNIDITSMNGSINTNGGGIASNSWLGSAGKISLQAVGTINTGEVNSRSDGTGNGGDIELEATENITTAELRSYVYGNGNSGNINVKSDNGIIDTREIQSGAYGSGIAGDIDITSTSSSISTNGSAISSNSWSGTAGKITLIAADTINIGEVNSRSDGTGNGGDIKLEAVGDITTKELRSYVWGDGNAGSVTVKSENGIIDTNGGEIATDAWSGTGGNITLLAFDAINVGKVKSNSGGSGNGGAISLTSTDGNITAKWLRSDSAQGTGGDIAIDAGKLVKITGSENIDELDYSIYNRSANESASVTIKHGGGTTDTPFMVGDAAVNGTQGAVSSTTYAIFPILNALVYPSSHTLGDISLVTSYVGSSPEPHVSIDRSLDLELNTDPVDLGDITKTKGLDTIFSPLPWNPPGRQKDEYYLGNEAHKAIGEYYRLSHPSENVILDRTVRVTVRDVFKKPFYKGYEASDRPDILNVTNRTIYEIKPWGAQAQALREAKIYIKLFKDAGVDITLGPVGDVGTYGILPAPRGMFVFGSPQDGVILHRQFGIDSSEVFKANDYDEKQNADFLTSMSSGKTNNIGHLEKKFDPTSIPVLVDPAPAPSFNCDLCAVPAAVWAIIKFIFNGPDTASP